MADPTREEIEELDALAKRLLESCVGHPNATIKWPHRLLHEAAAVVESHRVFMLRALEPGRNEELVKRLRRYAFGTINGLPQYPALTDILNEAADALSGQSAAPAEGVFTDAHAAELDAIEEVMAAGNHTTGVFKDGKLIAADAESAIPAPEPRG